MSLSLDSSFVLNQGTLLSGSLSSLTWITALPSVSQRVSYTAKQRAGSEQCLYNELGLSRLHSNPTSPSAHPTSFPSLPQGVVSRTLPWKTLHLNLQHRAGFLGNILRQEPKNLIILLDSSDISDTPLHLALKTSENKTRNTYKLTDRNIITNYHSSPRILQHCVNCSLGFYFNC